MKRYLLLASLLAACGPSMNEESTSSAAISSSLTGHYVLSGTPTSARWINDLNLHTDGTFEASFGTNADEVSGHEFTADGTYTYSGEVLTFDYVFNEGLPTTDTYSVVHDGSKLDITFTSDNQPNETSTIEKAAAPKLLEFAADASPSTVDFTIGDTALVWYDAHRDSCPQDGSTRTPVVMNGILSDDPDEGLQVVLPPAPVNGAYRALYNIPDALSFQVWFELSSSDCIRWDSNYGHNFTFSIAQP